MESWKQLFKDNMMILNKIQDNIANLGKDGVIIYPEVKNIFRIYRNLSPEKINVVILGQDPYARPGQANGYCFAVNEDVPIPPSLKRIFQEVGDNPKTDRTLQHWVDQGVFLLNCILTVKQFKPASHREIGWQEFTNNTIKYISDNCENVVFLLWGNYAKGKKELIEESKHFVLEAAHPSPLNPRGFEGCGHFTKTNEYLKRHKNIEIEW